MDSQDGGRCAGQSVAFAFLVGAVAGLTAGILLAPKSGEETRRILKGYARKTEEEVLERANEARAALEEVIEQGKDFIAGKKAGVEAAVKAGREGVRAAAEKCCS